MRDLTVALVQDATVWRDARANRELYGTRVLDLAGRADLIVLPETFLSGFSNEAIGDAETMEGAGIRWMLDLARETGAVLTGSLIVRAGSRVHNRLVWARPDGTLAHYDKRHLFRMAGEHERYAGGSERLIVEVHGWRVCPLVCYDLRFPVYSRNCFDAAAQRLDYDLLLYVANWPSPRRHAWRTLLRARAIENQAYVVGVNRSGNDPRLAYRGQSLIVDPHGNLLAEAGEGEQLLTATLDARLIEDYRRKFPALADLSPQHFSW